MSATVEQIDQLLPQTQCTQCGYNGCLPYAKAIYSKQARINQCPPGGQQTIKALATLLHTEELELNESFGKARDYQVAKIHEEQCIGCVKCIRACPVDAIVGAAKQMHTVIDEYCTGCELCIDPCPVDCIDMIPPRPENKYRFSGYHPDQLPHRQLAKQRFDQHTTRLHNIQQQKIDKRQKTGLEIDREKKRAYIKAAVARQLEKKSSDKK